MGSRRYPLATRGRRPCVLLVAVSALVASGCSGEDATAAKGQQRAPVAVEVAAIERGALDAVQLYVGELRARESVALGAKLAGRLRKVYVQLGDTVTEGQLLAAIEDADLRAQLDEASAARALAEASLRRAQVEGANAAVELARKQPLAADGLITAQELDDVRTRSEGAAAQLEVARAQVSQAEARARLLQQQLGDTRIYAPFAGGVAGRHLDPGAVVSPGTPILTLVQTDPLVARFRVPERDIGSLRGRLAEDHRAVSVRLDAYPSESFAGEIVRQAPAVDPGSRTVAVEAELPNGNGRLLAGMYCRVELPAQAAEDVLRLPLSAILDDRGLQQGENQVEVFVVEQGRATKRALRLGRLDASWGEILEGLVAGERIVVAGQSRLADGSAVNVVNRPAASAAEVDPPAGEAP